MDGGIELLMGLTAFDPDSRLSPLDVINSTFMEPLREQSDVNHSNDIVHSFMAYKTQAFYSD